MEKQSKKGVADYSLIREGEDNTLHIDYENSTILPSIEDSEICMSFVIEKLAELTNVTKIVLSQRRDYEYDYDQTLMLYEIAKLYNKLIKQKEFFNYYAFSKGIQHPYAISRYTQIQDIIFRILKSDPIEAYIKLKRVLRNNKIDLEKTTSKQHEDVIENSISVVSKILALIEDTKLIKSAKEYISEKKGGDREIYRKLFVPTIKPDFMYTKLMSSYPEDGEELDNYSIGDSEVILFKTGDNIQTLYHIIPPEFKLTEEKYSILDSARNIMVEHKPTKDEFTDPERMREVFQNVGYDLLDELARSKGIKITENELEELTQILVRYTIGFGLIEVLLQDEKIQDITINSPLGKSPIFIVHQDFDDCKTNIIPTRTESESWATKLRLISGRPLDEANPILDTEISIPGARARIAVISPPLNPSGLAFAFRRHRDRPWTLPLFIKNRMISPLAAGVISFIVDGARTVLVAGTRSAGKSSLLGSLMTEIMRKHRIITIEDTLELPIKPLKEMGYNIQSMKVAAALTKGTAEVPADEGIRTTLRLGDSCLIVGEVRSTEAAALYEAMRVGALANVVAGTIHADSPYGIYDRVVNDLGVPRTSFKATDIAIITNPIRSADGLHRWRRVTQITEVRKHWENDPILENGFLDLMKYDTKTDQLEPTDDLINGESEILKSIAGNVKEWAGNWDAVWDNIQLRANVKETLVKVSESSGISELLEAEFVIQSNDQFHRISDSVKERFGNLDSKRIFFEWNEWLKKSVKKIKMIQDE